MQQLVILTMWLYFVRRQKFALLAQLVRAWRNSTSFTGLMSRRSWESKFAISSPTWRNFFACMWTWFTTKKYPCTDMLHFCCCEYIYPYCIIYLYIYYILSTSYLSVTTYYLIIHTQGGSWFILRTNILLLLSSHHCSGLLQWYCQPSS